MAEQPKMLSERVSFRRTPEELTVVITQEVSRMKEALLFAWLMAWFAIGCVFVYYWLIESEAGSSDRIFFAISTAFWLYFFVKIMKVYLWRKIGKELLRIKDETLSYRMAFGRMGKVQNFSTGQIKKFGTVPYDFTKFGEFMDRSSWVIGGDMLGFEYRTKKILFGKQLNDQEARQLARIIEKGLREIPARARRSSEA